MENKACQFKIQKANLLSISALNKGTDFVSELILMVHKRVSEILS